jgi:hypothetical protein
MKTTSSHETQRALKGAMLIRQAFFMAGLILLLGVVLVLTGHAWGLVLAAMVAGGLMFSAVVGWCPMVFFLSKAPWNKGSIQDVDRQAGTRE